MWEVLQKDFMVERHPLCSGRVRLRNSILRSECYIASTVSDRIIALLLVGILRT